MKKQNSKEILLDQFDDTYFRLRGNVELLFEMLVKNNPVNIDPNELKPLRGVILKVVHDLEQLGFCYTAII